MVMEYVAPGIYPDANEGLVLMRVLITVLEAGPWQPPAAHVAPPSAGPPLRPAGAPVGLPMRGFSASRAKETTKAKVAIASKKGVFFMIKGFLSKFNQKPAETYILWP
jgi:hypothetical protein